MTTLDVIYVCIESDKTCYAIHTPYQDIAESFFYMYVLRNLAIEDDSNPFFLHESQPEGYTLLMEVIPRRYSFVKDGELQGEWSVIKKEDKNVIDEMSSLSTYKASFINLSDVMKEIEGLDY